MKIILNNNKQTNRWLNIIAKKFLLDDIHRWNYGDFQGRW